MHIKKHTKRAGDEATILPSITGFSGVASAASAISTGTLILNTDTADSLADPSAQYSLAPDAVTLTSTQSAVSTSSATSSTASPSTAVAAATSHDSDISIGAVVGICVGAFAGLAFLIFAFYLYSKRSIKDGKNRTGQWDKLAEGEDRWEGTSTTSPGERELQEKNSQMFKKSSPSMRTTRTKALEDDHGGFNLPPLEFAKYHPGLAKELALEQPVRPYAAQRGESGFSWDGSTVHEDSFLEMHSARVESGAMSPILGFAKATPVAESPVHKWESAEVLTMGDEDTQGAHEVQNPFNDVSEQRRSVANPFFNAQDVQRRSTRSRSNSRNNSRSNSRARSVSEATAVSRTASYRKSQRASNPFAGIQEVPVYRVAPPDVFAPTHPNSVASGSSANMFGAHAMKSLIAALDMAPEEVEERLRVMSMDGSMTSSRLSAVSAQDDDADIVTVRAFPMPPPAAHIES